MQELEDIRKLLDARSKHGHYQMLPPALINIEPTLSRFSHSRRLDNERYEWFSKKINFKNKRILDIGANIGYFSFRLATEMQGNLTTYEPFIDHSIAIDTCKRILGLDDNSFNNVNQGVSLKDIKNLKRYDIVLFFNVLQHAGEDFDSNFVRSVDDWRDYAVQYLTELRNITEYLIFQTGYTWLGHEGKFCDDDDILDFTIDLLRDAGWNIEYCGVVTNHQSPNYVDYEISNDSKNVHPLISFWTKYGIIFKNKFFNANLDYRFMERPLFICKS
ncbi:hypothetical protein AZH53_05535 [Methanomicrobiaceae archaeon CYW5]|uniref:DUF1698 domain-containing protein n=1 Tax=Methanovulcanius yangii TaxID=1789227 RepID=UPI0029C9D73E|nr:DUF1698 domain-containing protein [Methanovulcanius yangii]MBT8507874.1 hypothetical protein [Methanovulcanius yangii]